MLFPTPRILLAAALLPLLLPLQAHAASERQCYLDACAQITTVDCPTAGMPLPVAISGELQNPHRMSVTTYQLVANAEWRYTDTHQVQLLSGDTITSNGFLFASSFSESLQINRSDLKRLTLIFGPRSGSHGYYDTAVDFTLAGGGDQQVQIDVKPGSCPNPINLQKRGFTPVAVVGSDTLDVRQIDIASVRLAGVSPSRFSFDDVAASTDPASWSYSCSTEGPDGIRDLTLKFSTQELNAALTEQLRRPPFDGENVALKFSAQLKGNSQCGGQLSGQETIQIIAN